jgi:hypothetical protein
VSDARWILYEQHAPAVCAYAARRAEDPALARAFAELTATEREAIALVAWEAWTTSPPPAPPGAARARSPSGCPVPARA